MEMRLLAGEQAEGAGDLFGCGGSDLSRVGGSLSRFEAEDLYKGVIRFLTWRKSSVYLIRGLKCLETFVSATLFAYN